MTASQAHSHHNLCVIAGARKCGWRAGMDTAYLSVCEFLFASSQSVRVFSMLRNAIKGNNWRRTRSVSPHHGIAELVRYSRQAGPRAKFIGGRWGAGGGGRQRPQHAAATSVSKRRACAQALVLCAANRRQWAERCAEAVLGHGRPRGAAAATAAAVCFIRVARGRRGRRLRSPPAPLSQLQRPAARSYAAAVAPGLRSFSRAVDSIGSSRLCT